MGRKRKYLTEQERNDAKNRQTREWKKKNPDKVRAIHKAYCMRNPEKIKQIQKRYYQKNKKRFAEYQKEYQRKNREKCNEICRKYYHKHKEKFRAKDERARIIDIWSDTEKRIETSRIRMEQIKTKMMLFDDYEKLKTLRRMFEQENSALISLLQKRDGLDNIMRGEHESD